MMRKAPGRYVGGLRCVARRGERASAGRSCVCEGACEDRGGGARRATGVGYRGERVLRRPVELEVRQASNRAADRSGGSSDGRC